jgi:hypothetical protein
MPIFSVTRLSVLVGLWPLWLRDPIDRWCHGEGRLRSAVLELLERLGLVPEPGRGRGPQPAQATRAGAGS